MIFPDAPINKNLWWICPCGCRRWFKQKSEKIARKLKEEDINMWGLEKYLANTIC